MHSDHLVLDHLVVATPDPAATVGELAASTGVTPAAGGPHVGMGTRNWLAALATAAPGAGAVGPDIDEDTDRTADRRVYLEIIGPDPEQPDPESPRPFGIDDLAGPSLVWWCARTTSIGNLATSLPPGAGVEFSEPMEMRRFAPGGELRWMLSFPSDLGGAIPFVIAWLQSAHPSSAAPRGLRLDRFEIGHPQPDRLGEQLAMLGAFPIDVVRSPVVRLGATLSGPAGSLVVYSPT